MDASDMSQMSSATPFLDGVSVVESGGLENLGLAELLDISRDPCIDLYYKHFHRFHPCVLPRRCLEKKLQDTTNQASLRPLIAVMRYVGSLYCQSDQADRLRGNANSIGVKTGRDLQDPFMVQYHLINSVAQYWCGEAAQSREEMDRAISLAMDLKMHRQEFAVTYGQGDSVLQESWRRTWWQIYVVDAYYAAMKNATTFPTYDVDVTTELPCEEYEYESGVPHNDNLNSQAIPEPKTLDDFDSREFSAESHVYSSFSYLIGAVRGVSSAISTCHLDMLNGFSPPVLETVDAVIDGWMLLLPKSKRQILSKNGEFDEIMFQANMAIHA
ncbi:uncharacterized protein A1O9_10660 [Exophiala aquamarina CBS 119918]|uniref:Xylanolytic transcriptional activator regulatory domain-containing protein n=1 Tax=Exophiala aquamarina CBS 119918 TaxID=1182545 RepID=A0A072P0J6_9EURO|nr:uncharacterized protein A1O9_10660 [Exophiala aquamarina CBS 119918]KEF53212.1 hypothetical protein A1O9_10660 [Exophiala aquamarina CBS 119918]